jgi:type VI protein secretion system component VasK
MNPGIVVLRIPIVWIVCSTILKVARLRASQAVHTVPPELTARLATLEEDVRALQAELGETQERLDFTERLLSKSREERRLT